MQKKWYQMEKEEIIKELEVSVEGLTGEQAEQRKQRYGRNELTEKGQKGVIQVFLEQFQDFLVLILLAAAGISAVLKDWESAVVIVVVLAINAVLGTVQYLKAEQSLNSLKALSSPNAKVLRNGKKQTIPSAEVTVGDIYYLEAGDYICADGRILENFSLQTDESSLTGESLAVLKDTEAISTDVGLGDRKNMVFSGSFVTYGRATVLVTAIGMETEIGRVAGLLQAAENKKTPLQENLDDFGRKLSFLILLVCALVFALSLFRGGNVFDALLFAIALAVAAIPEALSSIVTIVLSFGTQKMAKENAIVRKLHAVEGLGSVSVICSDKTGTLTQNKMTVKKYYADGKVVEGGQENLENPLEKKLLLFAVLCNDAGNEEGKETGDPTEVALINYGDKLGLEDTEVKKQYSRQMEIPFDSDRKLMSTVYQWEGRSLMITKGAVDVLLDRIVSVEKEEGAVSVTEAEIKQLEEANRQFSENGLRVLAFAFKEIEGKKQITAEDENAFTFLGMIAMVDPPREESKAAVEACIKAGIRPVMITGDHKVTAAAIAKEIGILHSGELAVDGKEIDGMSDEALCDFVPKVSVYARVSPEHKIRIVKAWQSRGNIVAMTGDGVNDAPALKQADIGVAMGITGSEVAKDAASMVLTDDNFATIVTSVENGRNLYRNIKNAIQFLLAGNTAGIFTVLICSLFGLPVPFAAVHLLFINLLTDSLPAIALGLEPHTKEVMEQKPRPAGEKVLTKAFLKQIILEGFILTSATMAGFLTGLNAGGSFMASTMAFAVLCLSRLFHGFSCKKKKAVLFSKSLWNNPALWGAFGIGTLLLGSVLLLSPLQGFLSVSVLPVSMLFLVFVYAFLSFLCVQALKWIQTKN